MDGETLEKPQNINGTWQISSGEELAWFAALVNNTLEDGTPADEKANAVLCDDIDLGSNLWTPVGSASHKFQGTFDGNGFTVFNLKIESDDNDYVGFFGYINSAEIKNLMIKGQITASGRRVGGLVGRAEDNFKIINCGNFVDVTNQSTSSDYTAGILAESYYVNYSAKGTIEGCFNQGTIENSNGYASGIVASMSSGTIKNCYNSGLLQEKRR